MGKGKSGLIDKRVERSREKVLRETYGMLSERGFSGVSIDEIAKMSGVAKTTIYRHWPSRAKLLLDACSTLGVRVDTPDTGSLEKDLRTLVDHLGRELRSRQWSTVLPSIVDAAERDPEVAEVYKKLHDELMLPYKSVLSRAQQRGDISPDVRISEVLAVTVGALFYRRWFSREPLSERFLQSVVTIILCAVRRP